MIFPEQYIDPEEDAQRYGLSELDRGSPPMGSGMFDPKKKMDRPMTLEEILLAQAPFGARQKQLQMQLAFADQLRGEGMPQMRQAGRVNVAPNWMESANAGLRRGYGDYTRGKGMVEGGQIYDEGVAELRKLLEENKAARYGSGGGFAE
jgi:hypothetical protein